MILENILNSWRFKFFFFFFSIQVVIYENGKPILKVESGTTLEVVKLLYGTERSAQDNIIGVRPRQNGGAIPCIITLKDSRLEENAYDVITKGTLTYNHFFFSLYFDLCKTS